MAVGEVQYAVTARSKVKRSATRGKYDKEAVHAILDEAFLCHVAYVDDGMPIVIPTAYARVGEKIYLHGHISNRLLKSVKVCHGNRTISSLQHPKLAPTAHATYQSAAHCLKHYTLVLALLVGTQRLLLRAGRGSHLHDSHSDGWLGAGAVNLPPQHELQAAHASYILTA